LAWWWKYLRDTIALRYVPLPQMVVKSYPLRQNPFILSASPPSFSEHWLGNA
jgi:hypothetical protein